MKNRIISALVAGFTIVFLWVSYGVFDVYILGHCDPKFGCEGVIIFGAFISSVAGALNSLAYFIAASLTSLRLDIKPSFILAIVAGGVMAPVLNLAGHSSMELPVFVVFWVVLSIAVSAGVNYIESLLNAKNT